MKLSEIDANFKTKKVDETDIEWREISEPVFDLYGVYYSEKDGEYLRFPKEFAKSFNEYVYYHANRTIGGRVRFITDSPYVAIRVESWHWGFSNELSVVAQSGVSIYTDGYYSKSFGPDVNEAQEYEQEKRVSFEGVYKVGAPHKAEGKHEFTVCFPPINGVKKMYIGVKEGSVINNGNEYRHTKPVVFYGSSITMGIAASHPGNDYVSMLSRMLDTDYINYGLAGQAKGQREMAEYISKIDASVFVIDYDHNAPTPQHLIETHYPFYKVIRETHEDTPIIIMTQPNVDYTYNAKERRDVIYQTYERAVKEGDKNVYFIDGSDLFAGDLVDCCTADSCHPNDLGFYRMAKAVYPVLEKLLNK